jgi:TRAP-type C4-dicarboxylate transport system permease small subunit
MVSVTVEGGMSLCRFLARISSVVNKITAHVSIVFFVGMTLIVWSQIFYRFILGDGIVWAEEIAKFMMVWMALLGAAVVFYEKGHIAITFCISGCRSLRYIQMFHYLLSAVLFFLLIYYGISYAEFGLMSISPASGITRFWPYLAIPVGGGVLFIQSVIRIIQLAMGYSEEAAPLTSVLKGVSLGKEQAE